MRLIALAAAVAVAFAGQALAETALDAAQEAANSKPGPRTVPGREIPVPSTVSPEMAVLVANPYRPLTWNANPGDDAA